MPSTKKTTAAGAAVVLAAAGAVVISQLGDNEPDPRIQYIVTGFTNRDDALNESSNAMFRTQSPETRRNQNTVTRYRWRVVEKRGGGEWGLKVPETETNLVRETAAGRTQRRETLGDEWQPRNVGPEETARRP